MGNTYLFQSQIQADKYLECLMDVNNDLGILLQNAENLAYKLGAIDKKDLNYLSYDYYNQYEIKDKHTLRKNIVSSINFLKAQFKAFKQETGKEYLYPPSIDTLKKDVKIWKNKVKEISPNDAKFFDYIYTILDIGKFKEIKDSAKIYQICLENKKTKITPYMWMIMSPGILQIIDKNNEITLKNMEMNGQSMPDIIRGLPQTNKENIIASNSLYKETEEINKLLRYVKEVKEKGIKTDSIEEQIKLKILEQNNIIIEDENKQLCAEIMNFK